MSISRAGVGYTQGEPGGWVVRWKIGFESVCSVSWLVGWLFGFSVRLAGMHGLGVWQIGCLVSAIPRFLLYSSVRVSLSATAVCVINFSSVYERHENVVESLSLIHI